MKKLLLAGAVILLGVAGCSTKPVSADTRDGVTVELNSITYIDKNDLYLPELTISNHCGEDLSGVLFQLSFLDGQGKELGVSDLTWQAPETALADGASVTINTERYRRPFKEGKPASVSLKITEVHKASEYPLDYIPKEGDLLYLGMGDEKLAGIIEDRPVKIECGIDQSGWLRIATFEGDLLDEAIERFTAIRIGEDDGIMYTDNYNYITVYWPDGEARMLRINLDHLEVYANGIYHSYALEDERNFRGMIAEYLVDPNEQSAADLNMTDTLDHRVTAELIDPDIQNRNSTVKEAYGDVQITNIGDKPLTHINLELLLYDADDRVIGSKYLFPLEGKTLAAGEEMTYAYTAQFPDLPSVPVRTGIKLIEAVQEGEMKADALSGKYLYEVYGEKVTEMLGEEPPIVIEVYIDRMGYGSTVVFEAEEAAEAMEAFKKIKIGMPNNMFITDSYNRITLLFDNGEECNIPMIGSSLEYAGEGEFVLYTLEDTEDFRALVQKKNTR